MHLGEFMTSRDFCRTEEPCEHLAFFLSRKPGQESKMAKKLEPGMCSSFDQSDLPFEDSFENVLPVEKGRIYKF